MGVAEIAGGTVVEINCGITGLACAIMLGRRLSYGQENMAPWNLSYEVIGASLLWIGWMGFNAGVAPAANGRAGMVVLVTQIAAVSATLAWIFADWWLHGKPSILGRLRARWPGWWR
jgi:Amt family ammonium transporter